jgi:hypothetical protein
MDEFNIRKMNFEVFRDPDDPLSVVRNSQSGTQRARALRCLRDPLLKGSREEQSVILDVLVYSATNESQALCRMAAIDVLRGCKDSKAVEAVKEAYYRAGSFAPETATVIRCQALTALGEMGDPSALEVLVRVVREPPTEGPATDRQQKYNERIAAARALGYFNQYQATSALAEVLRRDQDNIALRNRVHESLVKATGKELPPDAAAWDEFLNSPASKDNSAIVKQPSVTDRFLQLTGLKEKQ